MDTSFVDGVTIIAQEWAQDVNNATYKRGVDVSFYGAVADGVSDCTEAFNNALADLTDGGLLHVGIGTFKVTSGIVIPDGVTIQGSGPVTTVIQTTSATSNVFTFNHGASIRDLKLSASVTRTAGNYIDIQGNSCTVENCEFENYYIGVNAGAIPSPQVVAPRISNCRFRYPATSVGSGGIQFTYVSNGEIYNCVLSGESSGTQSTFGIRLRAGDTMHLDGINVTYHGRALFIDPPAGYALYATTALGCLFDSAGVIAGPINACSAEITPAGDVRDTKFIGCWFGIASAADGCLIVPSGSGTVNGIEFTSCEFVDNAVNGLHVVGSAVTNWHVNGGWASGNGDKGIYVNGASTLFTIHGFSAGNIAGRGVNGTGIALSAAASDKFIISGCNLEGNSVANLSDASTGTDGKILNNRGYNFNLTSSFSTITVGASPYAYTAGHTPEVVYIYGGTVSSVSQSTNTIKNGTDITVYLAPGEAVGVVYTVAPTMRKKIL
jgi:hypothetical protein